MALDLLCWWLAVQAMALAAWPLCHGLLGRLDDAGWGLAKVFGLWLTGLIHWLGWAYGPWANGPLGAWLAVAIAAVGGWAWTRAVGHGGALAWPRRRWPLVLGLELLFLAAFLGWAWLRWHDPAANHTEQPMDMMLLTALWNSPAYPPQDAWLAGRPIGYYYFGHWLLGHGARLAQTGPWTAYNIGQAAWFAMCVTGAFSLARDAALAARLSARRALTAGGLAAAALCLAATPKGALLALDLLPRDNHPWWWFQATRVIDDVMADGRAATLISEFPFFSFYLGDNHAHLLALPLGLLAMGLCLAMLVGPPATPAPGGWLRAGWRQVGQTISPLPGGWLLALAALGALLPANTWDCAAIWPLAVLSVWAATSGGPGRRVALAALAAVALLVVSLAVYLPHLRTAQTQAIVLLPNAMALSGPGQFLLALGLPLAGGATAVAALWLRRRPGREHMILGLSLALGAPLAILASGRLALGAWPAMHNGLWTLAVAALPLGAALALGLDEAAARRPALPPGLVFTLILALIGLSLLVAPEAVVLRDMFASRMNTAFKLHYQAWLLLALAGAVGAVATPGRAALAVAAPWVLLLALGLAYPAALVAQNQGPALPPAQRGLDAAAWLRADHPDTWAAIQWLRANSAPGEAIAQAPGQSYNCLDNAVSTFSGRAAPLGWLGHQRQWRGEAGLPLLQSRQADLAALYAASDQAALGRAMARLGVGLVLVSARERLAYDLPPDDKPLADLLPLAFAAGPTRIYGLPKGALAP